MGELEDLRQRVEAVRREYASLPHDGWGDPPHEIRTPPPRFRGDPGEPGPPDERTGERWDRGNVLGHVAEMLPHWTGQVRAVLAGAEAMGRDEAGRAQRRAAIDTGRQAGEAGLLERIDEGIGGLLALLAEMRDADLDRPVRFFGLPSGDVHSDLRAQLDAMLVGHLEEHIEQLRSLRGQPAG